MNPVDLQRWIAEFLRWDVDRLAAFITGVLFGAVGLLFLLRQLGMIRGLGNGGTIVVGPPNPPPGPGDLDRTRWSEISKRLISMNINQADLSRLKQAMESRKIRLYNSDNRLRIMIWSHGGMRLPVALIWRGGQNHRVLFPDSTEELVKIAELTEIQEEESEIS